MNKTTPIVPEFSRPIVVGRLERGELTEIIAAREDERRALAARFGLVALDRLEAEVTLSLIGRGPVVRVEGRLAGDVVQTCVISLEPLENRIEESFVLTYAPARQVPPLQVLPPKVGPGKRSVGKKGVAPAAEEDDVELASGAFDAAGEPPEPLIGGQIDIGEAVAQQLALALDPYPRKPKVRLEDVIGELKGVSVGDEGVGAGRPFAALARLKRRKS
jgi:hypothetical protein